MKARWSFRRLDVGLVLALVAAGIAGTILAWLPRIATAQAEGASTPRKYKDSSNTLTLCEQMPWLCADSQVPYEGRYIGHDEPSLLFYSAVPGSGNSNQYTLILPKDPPTLPKQDGTGGTFNFQLHPAFWFGMSMCDTQSAPEFTQTCVPDTDANIFDNPDPTAPDYIGHHPGVAFMEMQFYPPGWIGSIHCDATHWCAALTIDSLNVDQNNGINNNQDCLNKVGQEPINFAFITKSGVADSPADPLNGGRLIPIPVNDLLMNPGDKLIVTMQDTPDGFQFIINDVTTRRTGSMTASIANGFKQLVFNPSATTCSSQPYAFHPMYSTSSEHTRVPWASHSYNIAFADEIGHFEYCNNVDINGNCISAGVSDLGGLDSDDKICFGAPSPPLVSIAGCTATESDFDGVPYQPSWPGTLVDPTQDAQLHPTSVFFTSPLTGPVFTMQFDRVAFEADLPAIESPTPCNRQTGGGCINPPPGANFYPFFSTGTAGGGCVWQLGGPNIPGIINAFGGNSTAEFGALLSLAYPGVGGSFSVFNDFRQVLSTNPCPAAIPSSPTITGLPPVIFVGASFQIQGSGFTPGSKVNFFIGTSTGPVNAGPFIPSSFSSSQLTVSVPATVPQGQGVAAVQVVNTDQGFAASNTVVSLLEGSAAAGLPSITGINGIPISSTSTQLGVDTANVQTVVVQSSMATINGMGFDTSDGVAVDLFCACPRGKVGPFFLNPGDSGLSSSAISFLLPSSGPNAPATGPGSFQVSNKGGDGSYAKKSNSISVPIGAQITITGVTQDGATITVNGSGFSSFTVINFFNNGSNLGGYLSGTTPKIPLSIISPNQFTFMVPAGSAPGPAYVQAINPPYIAFTASSGSGGAFTLH